MREQGQPAEKSRPERHPPLAARKSAVSGPCKSQVEERARGATDSAAHDEPFVGAWQKGKEQGRQGRLRRGVEHLPRQQVEHRQGEQTEKDREPLHNFQEIPPCHTLKFGNQHYPQRRIGKWNRKIVVGSGKRQPEAVLRQVGGHGVEQSPIQHWKIGLHRRPQADIEAKQARQRQQQKDKLLFAFHRNRFTRR